MKYIPFILFSLLTLPLSGQGLITLLHNGQSQFYTNIRLDSAYAHAQNGDTLLLPGEAIPLPVNGWVIDKAIHVIGVGHQTDSLGGLRATFLGGDMVIVNSANGASIENLHVSGALEFGNTQTNQAVTSCVFKRCLFGGVVVLGYSSSNEFGGSCLFQECIFADQTTGTSSLSTPCLEGQETRGNRFLNCIIERGISDLGAGNLFDHCLFLGYGSDLLDNDIQGCYFSNNIFLDFDLGSSAFSISNNTFIYNLVAAAFSPPIQNITGFNYENIAQAGLFVNKTQSKFSYGDDYHLANPSAYTSADGTPVGIFGGANAFKPSTTPHGPQLLEKQIQMKTDSLGRLPVRIRVKAQDY